MATTHSEAPPDVAELATKLIRSNPVHEWLDKAEVNIDFIMASSVTLYGKSVTDRVYIIAEKFRAKGAGDVGILISDPWWANSTPKERAGVLDHALTHIEVVLQSAAQIAKDPEHCAWKTDSLGRPKCKIRKHDFDVGGFYSVIEKHQENAGEIELLKDVGAKVKKLIQGQFWG